MKLGEFGIGKLVQSAKRKFRFTFESKEFIPEYFIRWNNRPDITAIKVVSGQQMTISGSVNFSSCFSSQTEEEYDKFKNNAQFIEAGQIRLYDGFGYLVESWHFYDANLQVWGRFDVDDENYFEVDCLLRYKSMLYENLTPPPITP